jgi:hypothetical protein
MPNVARGRTQIRQKRATLVPVVHVRSDLVSRQEACRGRDQARCAAHPEADPLGSTGPVASPCPSQPTLLHADQGKPVTVAPFWRIRVLPVLRRVIWFDLTSLAPRASACTWVLPKVFDEDPPPPQDK